MSRLEPALSTARRARRAAARVGDDDADFVAAAARTMAVLQAFSPEAPLLGNGEIAERSGLPKSTVSRLSYTLTRLGWLQLDASTQRYRLGAGCVSLARSFSRGRGVCVAARPHMEALALRFRAPVALTERDGLEMVYLEYCRGEAPVIVPRGVGSRVALARSAAGRAWLASAHPVEREAVLNQIREQAPRSWKAVLTAVENATLDLAGRGFTRSYGELQPEVNSIGVPMYSPTDGSLVVFNVAAPAMLVSGARFDREVGPGLVSMVQDVRRGLAPAMG